MLNKWVVEINKHNEFEFSSKLDDFFKENLILDRYGYYGKNDDYFCYYPKGSEESISENNLKIVSIDEAVKLLNPDIEVVVDDKSGIVEDAVFFRECLKSIGDMLEYKNKAYGNSALKPLDIFAKHHPYGSRIDEKLARVKNSNLLKKNDLADLLGGLILICRDRGWKNFDDLCD